MRVLYTRPPIGLNPNLTVFEVMLSLTDVQLELGTNDKEINTSQCTCVFLISASVVSEDFTNNDGLQDMTSWNKYLSWVCLPHFLWANDSLSSLFDMKPTTSRHSSQVLTMFIDHV